MLHRFLNKFTSALSFVKKEKISKKFILQNITTFLKLVDSLNLEVGETKVNFKIFEIEFSIDHLIIETFFLLVL